MSCIRKFVINRNNLIYLYTEKRSSSRGLEFYVYNGTNPTVYLPDTFYAIYGNDVKHSISGALRNIIKNMFCLPIKTDEFDSLYKFFTCFYSKIVESKSIENPRIGKEKNKLINCFKTYNSILNLNTSEDLINASDEWLQLNQESDEIIHEMDDTLNNKRKLFINTQTNDQYNVNSSIRIRE